MIKSIDISQQCSGAKYGFERAGRLLWTIWKAIWMYQFKALREVYWLMDPDAKVRSQGLRTVGRVQKTETRQHEDSEGNTYETHYVTYGFQAAGARITTEQKVRNIHRINTGDPIRVYYMPNRLPLRSAIEPRPSPEAGVVGRNRSSAELKAGTRAERLEGVGTRT